MPGDLFAILSQGGQSLAAHRAVTATASHNIQNVNTPGYARQRAELTTTEPPEDTLHGELGRGVSLLNVTQARDTFLENQLPVAYSDKFKSAAEADTLESVNALDPDAANGLTASLGQFYADLRRMSQNPGDMGLRQAVLTAGQSLTSTFNQTDHALATAREGTDARLKELTDDANRTSSLIADLNRKIRSSLGSTSLPNDLLDQRQLQMDKLSQLTGARPVPAGDGTISMMLPSGLALVSQFSASTLGVKPNAANGGHFDLTLTPQGGGNTTTIAATAVGGTAAGLIEARDLGLGKSQSSLDQLAYDFSTAFNTVHAAGYGLDNVTGRNFFTPLAAVSGAANLLRVDPAVANDTRAIAAAAGATTAPGDGTNLLSLIGTENQTLSGGTDVGESLGRVIADYGATTSQARARAEQDGHALDNLESLRESTSGVSIDEEMITLTKSQRAFEAVMKVITTSDQMLETLMNLR